jgi:hypothetical protein
MTTPPKCDCWTEDVWRPIHTLARISSIKENEEKAAFCTLILTLNRIISCPIVEKEVMFFMDNPDNDMMKYVSSNDRLFQWTVILRAHINKALDKDTSPTLSELTTYYDPKKLTKDIWGPQIWKLIHSSVLRVPLLDGFCTTKISLSIKAFITCIAILLPCPYCRKHAWEYYASHSIDDYLGTNIHAFEWTVLFHTEVTRRLNNEHGTYKKLYTPIDALSLYVTIPPDVNFVTKFLNKVV